MICPVLPVVKAILFMQRICRFQSKRIVPFFLFERSTATAVHRAMLQFSFNFGRYFALDLPLFVFSLPFRT